MRLNQISMNDIVDPFCYDCKIRQRSCFNILSKEDLDLLNSEKVTTHYKKDQTIFHKDRYPTGIYCLFKGKIKISKIGIDGKEQIVRFVLPGQLLGIRALIGGRNYSANATTLEDSIVCFINKTSFFNILDKYPNLTSCMLTMLSQLLEEAENKMTSMAQKPVRERLAETLLFLNNIFETESLSGTEIQHPCISLPREDLANVVGTATEVVIRLLHDFKEENLIIINGRKVTIVDVEKLHQIAKTSN